MTDATPTPDAPKPAEGNVEHPVTPAEPVAETTEGVRDPAKLLSAYEAEKEKRKSGDAERRELKAAFDALQAKVDGKEAEYAAEQKQRELEQTALGKANERIRRSEVKAAAKGVLADPADAYKFLDLDSFEVDDDGNVDEDAIAKALADLVKDKPYLAAQGGKRFQGSADGGTRNGSGPASQLSVSDLEGMSPEAIVQAKAEGRLNDALGIKS